MNIMFKGIYIILRIYQCYFINNLNVYLSVK